MNRQEEAEFNRKSDQYFRSQRELQNGRNFLWNRLHSLDDEDMDNYRRNFDQVFPDAPGAGL